MEEDCWIQFIFEMSKIMKNLTLKSGEPLISTLSANLTLLGFDFSFAFLAADRRADFRLEL